MRCVCHHWGMTTKRLHLCRPGTYDSLSGAKVTLTADDLRGCAAAYDPAVYDAPLVVGHPTTDAPAHGWVTDLAADDDGLLTAGVHRVSPAVRDANRAGQYRRISASFFPPNHPRNPRPESWYLRHVGLLGAAEPAVHNLPPVELGAAIVTDMGADDIIYLSTEIDMPETSPDPKSDDLSAASDLARERAALAAERAKFEADRAAFEAAVRVQQQEEITAFAAAVVGKHGYAPHLKATIETVLLGVIGGSDTIEFGAPEQGAAPIKMGVSPALRRLVDALADPANRVPSGEKSAPTKGAVDLAAGTQEDQYAAEYARDPKLQAEFSSAKTYAAYRAAETAGRVKINTGLTQE